jgi:hypothetical protein
VQDFPASYNKAVITHPLFGYELEYDNQYSQPFGDLGKLDSSLPSFLSVPDAYGNFIPKHAKHDEMLVAAVKRILPLIKAELSLPNSIYELKDFKGKAKAICSYIQSDKVGRLLKRLDVRRKVRNLSFKQAARGLAGLYLEYMFNLAPLVSDIASIHKALSLTSKRIDVLIREEGRLQRRHSTVRFVEFVDPPPDVSNNGYLVAPVSNWNLFITRVERKVVYEPTVFHVELEYQYTLSELQKANAQLLGYLDALGINLNPAIIWNAIPWTFVVDWVLGVSKFLDSLKVENMRPRITIVRHLWSIKRTRRIGCRVYTPFGNPYVGPQNRVLPGVIETAYRRDTNFMSNGLIISSGLSLTECSLGAALVITRRRHSKHAWTKYAR